MTTLKKINLLDFDRKSLADFFVEIGEKSFRADQLIQWIHQLGITDFSLMTNLSIKLREYLTENAEIRPLELVDEQISKDGTRKWLFKLDPNKEEYIETVFIPEDDRGTLCVSSQVGCALKCIFCKTGELGFKRNLEVAEIIGQLWFAIRNLAQDKTTKSHAVTNVVFMGMGEPLLNFDNVVKALNLMFDDLAYGLSKYRVTVSTSGIVSEMRRLREVSKAALAVSLHAPDDELRSKLMPINKKYPLKEIIAVLKDYYRDEPKRMVTIEYIMIAGINDSISMAKKLVKILTGIPCKVNLIPFNSGDNQYQSSSLENINKFRDVLMCAGINTVTRKSRGADIAAACGQLAGQAIIKN